MKTGNWSLNLEDDYYGLNPDELVKESIEAVKGTASGFYVNIVTPSNAGDPNDWIIERITKQLALEKTEYEAIQYIDECGCGGYVTRVFK